MAYSRIRFEIQNSATMTLVHSSGLPVIRTCLKISDEKNSAPRKNREAELIVSDLIPKEVDRSSGKEED